MIQSTFHSGTCQFLLKQELNNIIEIGNTLILQSLCHEGRFVFRPKWDSISGQYILGLPDLKFETWQDACAGFYLYLRSLQENGSILAQFRRWMAQVWFWLFFDMFCEELSQKDSMTATTPGYDINSMKDVQYQILAKAYPGYAYDSWGEAR
ncbi:hypothetical protein BDV19DRAFT_395229 [Aspergillus venezuelensis]